MQLHDLTVQNIAYLAASLILILFGIAIIVVIFWGIFHALVLWLRYRTRESISLNSVLLQVTVPRENETKIDAAEQLFASLHALYGTKPTTRLEEIFEMFGLPGKGFFEYFRPQP